VHLKLSEAGKIETEPYRTANEIKINKSTLGIQGGLEINDF
jgi:hypothetical protein